MRILQAISIFFKVLFNKEFFQSIESISETKHSLTKLEEEYEKLKLKTNLLEASQNKEESADELEAGACAVLALLQREARFLDFAYENIDDLKDEEVGSVARSVNQDLKKALNQFAVILPVIEANEGSKIRITEDRKSYEYKIQTDSDKKPPFEASLIHRGYLLKSINLPKRKQAIKILAPALLED